MVANQDIERRTTDGLELRRLATSKRSKLTGRPIVYDSLSLDLGSFKEKIAKNAFSRHLRQDPDVRGLVDHDPSRILGRTRAGTLSLVEDDNGITTDLDVAPTQAGADVLASVERGDLTGMSFSFRTITDSWNLLDGEPVRTIEEAELLDVSIVAFPAYENTTVSLRSLETWRKTMPDTLTKPPVELPTPNPVPEVPAPAPQTEVPLPENRSVPAAPIVSDRPAADFRDGTPTVFRDGSGRETRCLKPEHRFVDLHRVNGEPPLSMGRAIIAMVRGDWRGAEAEQRALSTTANPVAGVLVPDPLAATVIDKARGLSVLVRAGAQTIEMTSSTLVWPKIVTDATLEVKAGNSSFSGSDIVFGAIEMTATTIGTVVSLSRELAMDSPVAEQVVSDALARKLAERIDFYGLQGSGGQQPLGLINFSDTNTDNVGGSVDYANALTGIEAVETDNHVPTSFVGSPANFDVLRKLLTNSEANHYAVPPPAVAALTWFSTSLMPDTDMVIGDFTKFIIGLRQGPVIGVSTEGDSAFSKHQVLVKVTWRGTFNVTDPTAFTLLQSIS